MLVQLLQFVMSARPIRACYDFLFLFHILCTSYFMFTFPKLVRIKSGWKVNENKFTVVRIPFKRSINNTLL